MEHYYNPEIETMPREEMKKLQSAPDSRPADAS